MRSNKVEELSPEKAGVGGSIPSLAAIKSTTYRPFKTGFHSVSFQNSWPAGIRLSVKSAPRDMSVSLPSSQPIGPG
jgi:hypothetical protein